MHPLEALAATASVSYRERLDRATLDAILREGRFDGRWAGHVMTLVEETPIEMLARAVASYPKPERAAVLAGLRALGRAIGCDRIERWMTG